MTELVIWSREPPYATITPELRFDFHEAELSFVDDKWTSYRRSNPPQTLPAHHAWVWRQKPPACVNHVFVALIVKSEVEGMMMLCLDKRSSQLPGASGRQLIYIEYLEVAPWNQGTYAGNKCRFAGVGTCLLEVAIRISDKEGCGGRLGLHSLEDAQTFYLKQGFQNLGFDYEEKLDYFELSDKVLDRGIPL